MRPTGTALVLGGGGSAGNAWLIGVVAGLRAGGLDAARADLVVGTSAGSTAAAQLTSAAPADLLAEILDSADRPSAPVRAAGAGGRPTSTANHLERTGRIIAAAQDPAEMRRLLGAAAIELEAATPGAWSARWRAIVAARLPSQAWPRGELLITAVDAATGDPVVFDRSSGVDLVDAVAASCSSGAAYRIGGSLYIDGGYRSNADNADLAAGRARVLVLSPFGGRSRTPARWGLHLAAQVEGLRARGSRVETVFPDDRALRAFGDDMMHPTTRPPAARAGYDQGRVLAGRLAGFWSGRP